MNQQEVCPSLKDVRHVRQHISSVQLTVTQAFSRLWFHAAGSRQHEAPAGWMSLFLKHEWGCVRSFRGHGLPDFTGW